MRAWGRCSVEQPTSTLYVSCLECRRGIHSSLRCFQADLTEFSPRPVETQTILHNLKASFNDCPMLVDSIKATILTDHVLHFAGFLSTLLTTTDRHSLVGPSDIWTSHSSQSRIALFDTRVNYLGFIFLRQTVLNQIVYLVFTFSFHT